MGFINIPGESWKPPVEDVASLPTVGNQDGDARITLDTHDIYIWDGSTWNAAGGGGGMSIGGTVTGGTAGSVLFVGPGSMLAEDNSNFFFDDTNNQLELGFGSALLPAYTFRTDDDTGAYRSGANEYSIATSGTQRTVTSAAGFGINASSPGTIISATSNERTLEIRGSGIASDSQGIILLSGNGETGVAGFGRLVYVTTDADYVAAPIRGEIGVREGIFGSGVSNFFVKAGGDFPAGATERLNFGYEPGSAKFVFDATSSSLGIEIRTGGIALARFVSIGGINYSYLTSHVSASTAGANTYYLGADNNDLQPYKRGFFGTEGVSIGTGSGSLFTPNYHLDIRQTISATPVYTQWTIATTTGTTSTDGLLIGLDGSGNTVINNQEFTKNLTLKIEDDPANNGVVLGDISITGGSKTHTSATGAPSDIFVTAGSALNFSSGAPGGNVTITSGNGGIGGSIILATGNDGASAYGTISHRARDVYFLLSDAVRFSQSIGSGKWLQVDGTNHFQFSGGDTYTYADFADGNPSVVNIGAAGTTQPFNKLFVGSIGLAYEGGDAIPSTSVGTIKVETGTNLNLDADQVDISTGNLSIETVGKGIDVKEGTNARQGISTLVGGTVTVSTTAVTANSRIFLTHQNNSGTVDFVSVTARTANTSFTITSASALDTSDIAWEIFEPA